MTGGFAAAKFRIRETVHMILIDVHHRRMCALVAAILLAMAQAAAADGLLAGE